MTEPISPEEARGICDKIYTTEALAGVAGERLRRAGYRVNRILTGERHRHDGLKRVAEVLHPDPKVDEPVGELVAVPRRYPGLRPGDPGE